jgi:hypothetical protein
MLQLLETEKSYSLQQGGFFTVTFSDLNYKINIIELAKVMKQSGVEVVKINSIQQYFKRKTKATRGSRSRNVVLVKRPRKFLIKLKIGQILDKEAVEKINKKLGF